MAPCRVTAPVSEVHLATRAPARPEVPNSQTGPICQARNQPATSRLVLCYILLAIICIISVNLVDLRSDVKIPSNE